MLGRLRAALTPQALLAVVAALMLAAAFGLLAPSDGGTTDLERRIGRTLSEVEGAGSVRVVILTRREQTGQGSFSGGAQAQDVPSGAVAVAQGAGDPLVNLRLTQALCSLLGLPASAVSVMSGTGGD